MALDTVDNVGNVSVMSDIELAETRGRLVGCVKVLLDRLDAFPSVLSAEQRDALETCRAVYHLYVAQRDIGL